MVPGPEGPAPPGRSAGPLFWTLPLSLILAARYLRSTRKDAFTSFLSAVAGLGIALGVTALILALAALAGMQEALRSEVLARTPQIEVELRDEAAAEALAAAFVAEPEVTGVQRVLPAGRGWIQASGLVQTVEVVGYAGELPSFFPDPSGSGDGLWVSDGLATRWGLEPGETLQVISPRPTLTPFGPQPRVRNLVLAGTFASGKTEEVERVAVPLEVARSLSGGEGVSLAVSTTGLETALAVADRLRGSLPAGAMLRTWRELNRPLFFALRLEKAVTFVAVALVMVVAAMALVADLALVIANKRTELGMLATMGAAPLRLRRAFLALGGLLAGAGTLLGGLLGIALATALDRFRLVRLPGEVYFLDYLPFRLEAADLGAVLLTAFALALGSSLWVAQRVARLRPVEALRR